MTLKEQIVYTEQKLNDYKENNSSQEVIEW